MGPRTVCLDFLPTVKPEAKPPLVGTRVATSLSPARSVIVLTSFLPHSGQLWVCVSEGAQWSSSEVTPPPQQTAEAHSHIFHLESVHDVQVEAGLLRRPEVDRALKPTAHLLRSGQVEDAGRSFAPLHLQLQAAPGLISAQTLVTHVHVQNVGPRAVDVDAVATPADQTHPVAAANVAKLQRSVAGGVWRG